MPNYFTHLAVAKRYAEKNNITGDDAKEFFLGNVAPDLFGTDSNKRIRHFYRPDPRVMTVENFCKDRVNFDKFFAENKVQTQFERGYLMHLVTDNFCYHSVLDIKRLVDSIKKGTRARAVLVKTFDSVNAHLQKKYMLDYNMTGAKDEILACLDRWAKRNAADGLYTELNLLATPQEIKKLDDFIEEISGIDLDAFIAKHKQK